MEQYTFDENNGIWYECQGEYYFPMLSLPDQEYCTIGVWGRRHLQYIQEYRKVLYNSLVLSGKLGCYLAEIDQQAQDRFDILIQQAAQVRCITEELKATDPITWVGKMNNIRAGAEETINAEIIFV